MEKKTKKKFWGTLGSYLLTFMFISSWAVLGVALALSVANVNVGGNISFTAKDVMATVSKATFAGNGATDAVAEKCKELVFTAESNATNTSADIATWTGLELTFVKNDETGKADDVTITFTITGNDTEKNVLVNIGDIEGTMSNATSELKVTKAGTDVADKTAITLANDESVTVVMTFKVTDANKAAKVTGFNLPIELKAENA